MTYFVYIIYNQQCDKFYIGQTYNLEKRIIEHNLGLSKYTKRYRGKWVIKYSKSFNTRKNAMEREKFLKKQKNKTFYWELINKPTG